MAKKKSRSNQQRVPVVNTEASFVDKKGVIPPPPPAAEAALGDGEDKPQEAEQANLKMLNDMLVHRVAEHREQVSELSAEKMALEKVAVEVKEKIFAIEAEKEELYRKHLKLEDECALLDLQLALDSAVVSSQMSVCNGEMVGFMEARKEKEMRKEAEMEALKKEVDGLQRKILEMEKSAMAAAKAREKEEKELRDAVRSAEESVLEKSRLLDAGESEKLKLENAIAELNDLVRRLEESAKESGEREAALQIQAAEGKQLKEKLSEQTKELGELSSAKKEADEKAESANGLLEKLKLEKEKLWRNSEKAATTWNEEKEKLEREAEELKVKLHEMELSSFNDRQTWKLREEDLNNAIKTQTEKAREASRLLAAAEKAGEAEKQKFRHTISSLHAQISESSVAADESKQKEEALRAQAEVLKTETARLNLRIEDLEREIEDLSGERNRAILEAKSSLNKITNLEEEGRKHSEKWKIAVERKEIETGDLKQRIAVLEQNRDEWRSKCEEFEELVARKLLQSFRATSRTLKTSGDCSEARERSYKDGVVFETVAALEALFEEELGFIRKAFGEKGEEAAELTKRAAEAEREVVVYEKREKNMKAWQMMLSSIAAACAAISIAVITKTRW